MRKARGGICAVNCDPEVPVDFFLSVSEEDLFHSEIEVISIFPKGWRFIESSAEISIFPGFEEMEGVLFESSIVK